MQKIDEILNRFGLEEFEKIKPLKQVSTITGVKVSYIVAGSIVLLLLLVVLNFGSFLISSLVGFIYPAYMSFKAVESSSSDDDTQWLTYWVVYAFFTVFNDIIYYFLSFIPFYYLIKLVFYVWLFHPLTKGAEKVYKVVIQPILAKYEKQIDKATDSLGEKVGLLSDEATKIANEGTKILKEEGIRHVLNTRE